MDGAPNIVDSMGQRGTSLVWNHAGGMPAGASIDHVEDAVLADEHEVALALVVELVGNV